MKPAYLWNGSKMRPMDQLILLIEHFLQKCEAYIKVN